MVPVPTEDFEPDPPGGSFWQSLLNLAISVLVVCAAALIGSFLSTTSAHAETARKATAGVCLLQKAPGLPEKMRAPPGRGAKWVESPAGPQRIEGLDLGAVDVGRVGGAPPISARS